MKFLCLNSEHIYFAEFELIIPDCNPRYIMKQLDQRYGMAQMAKLISLFQE